MLVLRQSPLRKLEFMHAKRRHVGSARSRAVLATLQGAQGRRLSVADLCGLHPRIPQRSMQRLLRALIVDGVVSSSTCALSTGSQVTYRAVKL